MKTLAITAAALGLALTGAPALAGDPAEKQTMKLSLAGIDLSTPEGQDELDRRIDRAARAICQLDRISTGTRIRSREAKECFKTAKASAEKQVAAIIENRRRGG